jgi:hypothetical protein
MSAAVKRALLVLLVVVVVVTGLPLAMGMGTMASCPECGPAVLARAADCLPAAVLVFIAGFALALMGRLRLLELRPSTSLFAALLERPPRLA